MFLLLPVAFNYCLNDHGKVDIAALPKYEFYIKNRLKLTKTLNNKEQRT
jgi:hypothetical protein